MSISLINDWRYLLSANAIGGRFASFSFVMISYLHTGLDEGDELNVDGFVFVILGIGVKIRR